MKCLLIILAVGVSASVAVPSGLLGYGGLGYGGLGYGGLGYGGLGYGYSGAVLGAPLGTTYVAAPGVVQKTIVTSPGVIATGPILAPAVATPTYVAAAPAVVAASPAVAAKAVVVGPSGIISSKQVNPGGVAAVAAPYGIGYGGLGLGH